MKSATIQVSRNRLRKYSIKTNNIQQERIFPNLLFFGRILGPTFCVQCPSLANQWTSLVDSPNLQTNPQIVPTISTVHGYAFKPRPLSRNPLTNLSFKVIFCVLSSLRVFAQYSAIRLFTAILTEYSQRWFRSLNHLSMAFCLRWHSYSKRNLLDLFSLQRSDESIGRWRRKKGIKLSCEFS